MASKLAPHSLRPTAAARQMVEAGCRLVKLVNDFGPAAEYLRINPDLVIVGRVYSAKTYGQRLAEADNNTVVAARRFVNEQKAIYQANPLIRIWEGLNEESFGGPDDAGALHRMAGYAAFEAERVDYMAALDLRCVVGNFSTGYPEINRGDLRMWQAFLPALQAAHEHGGMLGLHEYAAPWLWWWAGDYQKALCLAPTQWRFPGGALDDMGHLTLRYRQVYRFVILPRGLAVPLVITECGADTAGGGCAGMPAGNWRDLIPFWQGWNGQADPIDYWRGTERDPERYYAEQLIWYDRELQKDPYVVGATIFTFGADSATWQRYRVDDAPRIVARLVEHIRASNLDNGTPHEPPWGEGGNDMAVFHAGQTVYVIAPGGVNLLDEAGNKQDTASFGDSGRVADGPRSIKGAARWLVEFAATSPAAGKSGWIDQQWLDAEPAPPASAFTERGKMKPTTHQTLPLMRDPATDSQIQNINADQIVDGYLAYDRRPVFARGINWYHTTGLGVDGTRNSPEGFLPCRWPPTGKNVTVLEIYPSDGKRHPDCNQQIVDTPTPPTEPPPVEPPPTPPPADEPVSSLLENGHFGDPWTTGGEAGAGNQQPSGWRLAITPNGQPNLWPTHLQGGREIPSIAQVVPECVHKLPAQLPANEQRGQRRALILPGAVNVYKLFGKGPWSAKLEQTINGLTPGRSVHAEAFVLGETPDKPTVPSGLEPDHFRFRLMLGTKHHEFTYAQAIQHRMWPNNERNWSLLMAETTVAPDGTVRLSLDFQQMWPGVVDFFIGPVLVNYSGAPPDEPPPDEPPTLPDLTRQVASLRLIEDLARKTADELDALGRG